MTNREIIAAQLETAAKILRRYADGRRDDSAAWRVADAGLMLRRMMENDGWRDGIALTKPTGMGALLPTSNA